MRILLRPSLFRNPAALLMVSFTPVSNAAAETVAHWTFSQTSGSVINTSTTGSERNNGWIGYTSDNSDDTDVVRDGTGASFNGQRNSIILIDDSNHIDFNPGIDSFAISSQFIVDQSVLTEATLGLNQTWNLVQRGRFNNSGGQWKMQIRKSHSNKLFLQCLVNDDKPETKSAKVQIMLKPAWIKANHSFEGRCTLDREDQQISVELTNTTQDKKAKHKAEALPSGFGSVAPRAGECSSPESFGGNVAIGNKPLCPDQELDTDDAFRGVVFSVSVHR